MAGQFMKGALISFMPTFVGSLPNVIVFQYNPDTITHTWTATGRSAKMMNDKDAGTDPLAADQVPGESFSFKLSVDSNEMIAAGNAIGAGLAQVSGVYTRLAALEMLQYPSGAPALASLVGSVAASISAGGLSVSASAGASAQNAPVPRSEVPVVLFVWGPQRIVPVRVTQLSITETMYDTLLNPIHADVSITLQVLTPELVSGINDGEMKQIAKVAYAYTQGLRQVQAVANLGDAAASILGMLPSPF